jgi:hypothetical protein
VSWRTNEVSGERRRRSQLAEVERGGYRAYTSREEARTVVCPRCGADIGAYCRGRDDKLRISAHAARHRAAVRVGATIVRIFPRKTPQGNRRPAGEGQAVT